MLIDIHTHEKRQPTKVIEFVDGIQFVGLHPWFIKDNYKDELLEIKAKHLAKDIPFIGETGLDRLKSEVDFEIQKEVFNFHLDLSTELKRPLVIHCLKAHSDLLHILKEKKYTQKFLIHDFSGGEKELKEYLKFNAYFSFGRSLFRENSKAAQVFPKIPSDRFFLETDDSKDFDIDSIYKKASELRVEVLSHTEDQVLKNFLEFFNYTNDIRPADIFKNFC